VTAVKTTDKYIISGCADAKGYVWSRNGQLLTKIDRHSDCVKCVDVLNADSDDMRLITGSQDQTIIIWKLQTESNSGKSRKTSSLVATAEQVLRGHERSVECLATNRDGTRIVSGGFDSYLKVWNTSRVEDDVEPISLPTLSDAKKKKSSETEIITKTPMVTLSGHRDAIVGTCWSPTSEKEVITVSWDHSIIIWDLELAGQKSSLSSTKSFTSVSMSTVSGYLLTSSIDSLVRLWDPRSTEGSMVKQTFAGHTGWISRVCGVRRMRTRSSRRVSTNASRCGMCVVVRVHYTIYSDIPTEYSRVTGR